MANKYTSEQKAEALAKLVEHGGDVKSTARALGIPRTTLINWRDKSNNPAVLDTIPPDTKQARIDLWDKGQELGVHRLMALIPTSDNLRDIAYATDRLLAGYLDLTEGRKGTNISIDNSVHVQSRIEAILLLKERGDLPRLADGNSVP